MGGVVSAIGLYILVSVFSSGSETRARFKILALAFGSLIVQVVLPELIPNLIGLIAGLILSFVLIGVGLVFWCEVERKAALKIVGAYFALCVVLSIVSVVIRGPSA